MLKKLFRFDPAHLFTLYTAIMLPLHIWVIFSFLDDFGWISARSTAWGALGVGAYALAIILAESLTVFLALLVLGWLLPARFSPEKRVAILALSAWLPTAWAIWTQSAA